MVTPTIKPWLSVRDCAVIEELVSSYPMRVLELGSGGSTLAFQNKTEKWIAVEHDPQWYERIKGEATVLLETDIHKYISHIDDSYNLIIVDGIVRELCLMAAIRTEALVLCHDARRREYNPYVNMYLWNGKIGDDLFIMANRSPHEYETKVYRKYEGRGMCKQSYPWDPIHKWGQHHSYCGYQRCF